jgi:hypothetical protein
MTAEVFIANMAVKNLMIYGFSYFVNDWTAKVGVKHAFHVWGGVALAITATTPVLYFWGKRYRSFWARKNLLAKMGIVTHEE